MYAYLQSRNINPNNNGYNEYIYRNIRDNEDSKCLQHSNSSKGTNDDTIQGNKGNNDDTEDIPQNHDEHEHTKNIKSIQHTG